MKKRHLHLLLSSLAFALTCLAGAFAWSGQAAAQAPAKNPVVLVIFDEFSTASLLDKTGKKIHKKRFPNFHRLSREGAWYRKHTTVADWTTRAVPAILTGNSGPETMADYRFFPDSIYTLLGNRGYSLRNLEVYTQLCPPKHCKPPGKEFLDPYPSDTPGSFGRRILETSNQNRRTREWVRKLRRLDSGDAAVAHILLPHWPWRYLPNGQSYDHEAGLELYWHFSPSLLDTYHRRMFFQIGYVDLLLGRIISSIKKSGQWNQTMLVVAGDHGLSLKAETQTTGARPVTSVSRHEIALTPLFIKYPARSKRKEVGRQERMAKTIDIVPTISDTLRLKRRYPTDGRSLFRVGQTREVGVTDRNGVFFPIDQMTTNRWLRDVAAAQARRLGNRGLAALGPLARMIGTKAPMVPLKGVRLLALANSDLLKDELKKRRLPPLVEGYVEAGQASQALSEGSRLLLALDNRFVASTSVHAFQGKLAFSFLVHPKYLKVKGKGRLRIFLVTPRGKRIRIS